MGLMEVDRMTTEIGDDTVNRCHTQHMSNLLWIGHLYDSMPFETMAEVMTLHGLDTTHAQAMDAYDNCWILGYPQGGNPKAIHRQFGITSEQVRRFCPICSTEVETRRRTCQECGYGSGRGRHTHGHVTGRLEWIYS